MADDCIPASPLSYRANKRKSKVWRQRSKRFRGNATAATASTENSAKEVSASAELSTILEESPCAVVEQDKPAAVDFMALYWPEPDIEAEDIQNCDIFAEARLLELANRIPPAQPKTVAVSVPTQGFTALCQIPKQSPPADRLPETQLFKPIETQLYVTETQLSHLCQVADAVADLQRNISNSQWNSPLAKAAVSSTPQSIRPLPNSQIDIDYFSESDDDTPTKPHSPPRKARRLDEAAAESYSRRKFNMQTEKASRKRIHFYDDSDSKSCLSSELSVQGDDGIVATPIDNVDLNKSAPVRENLLNLSSFFSSQSFTQDDIDETVNGVFRYIMLMKSRRKEVRMLDWFRSGRNFRLDDTGSSRSFYGFREADQESDSISWESSRRRRSEMNIFLDDDDHLFREVEEECSRTVVAEAAELDIEGVLQSADRVLQEATEAVRIGDFNSENSDGSLNNEEGRAPECEINIEALLKDEIIASFNETSLSTSIAENCTSKWNLNHKSCNSLSASVIELAEEINSEQFWRNIPKMFNDEMNFAAPKSTELEQSNLSNMPSCSKNKSVTHQGNQVLDSSNMILTPRINHEQDFLDLSVSGFAADWIAETQFPSNIHLSEVDPLLQNIAHTEADNELKEVEALPNNSTDGEFLNDFGGSLKNHEYNPNQEKQGKETSTAENFNAIPKLGNECGFQLASGKSMSISESARLKAAKLIAEFEKEFDQQPASSIGFQSVPAESFIPKLSPVISRCPPEASNPVPKLGSGVGFQLASGKAFSISESARLSAQKLIAEFEKEFDQPPGFQSAAASKMHSDSSKSKLISNEKFQIDHEFMAKLDCNDNRHQEPQMNCAPASVSSLPTENFGFQLASGKATSISDSARLRAEKLMAEFENDFDQQLAPSFGYQSGKDSFLVTKNSTNSDTTPALAGKSEINDRFTVQNDSKTGPEFGFQLASGKTMSISESARLRAAKLMADFENEFDQLPEESFGFESASSARGSSSRHKSETKNSCNSNFQSGATIAEIKKSEFEFTDQIDAKTNPTTELGVGFKLASGKAMAISESARLRAAKLMAEFEKDFDQQLTSSFQPQSASGTIPALAVKSEINDRFTVKNDSKTGPEFGFQLASGKTMSISESARLRAANLMADFEKEFDLQPATSFGFQSASSARGSSSRLKSETTNSSNSNFECGITLPKIAIHSDSELKPKTELGVGFQLASGKSLAVSETARLRAAKLMAEFEMEFGTEPVPNFKIEQKTCVEFQSIGKSISELDASSDQQLLDEQNKCNNTLEMSVKNKNLKVLKTEGDNTIPTRILRSISARNSNQLFENSAGTPKRPVSMSPIVKTLSSQMPTSQAPTPERSQLLSSRSSLSLSKNKFKPPALLAEKFITPIKSIPRTSQLGTPNLQEFFDSVDTSTPKNCIKSRARHSFSLTQEISASTAALLEDETDNFTETVGLKQINWEGFDESYKENVPDYVLKERDLKRSKQVELIQSKRSFRGAVVGGVLFTKKNQPNRKKLSDLNRNISQPDRTVAINFENALFYKFEVPANVASIRTEDGGDLIPDNSNRIGLEEIKNSFLSLEAVSPRLIPDKWLDHHYKMIVLKLYWLETITPGAFLNPQNVLLQLKYRYDHEIDRAHRSSLKRILECDDSPAKRIVLVVAAIYRNQFDTELELSDRWYSIRTTIDIAMQNLISSGKIVIGTKLMIQSAELSGCENGCLPLEIADNVRLRIHTNSTRRAKWDTKLGFYRDPIPFRIRFDRIDQNGGVISKLALCVLRVYPSTFMTGSKKDGNVSGFHSEKIELLLRKQEDVSKFTNIETIFSQVQNELDAEERKNSKSSFCNRKSLKDITDPAELYELVRWEWDFCEIESELTSQQLKILNDYQQQIQNHRLEEVQKRVKDRLQNQPCERRAIELYKIRVIEPRNPRNSAILSLWRPCTEIKSMLQERTTFRASHIIPNGIRCGELQLTSSKMSRYCILENMKPAANISNNLEQFFRRSTRIRAIRSNNFKPTFNELDTCGLIVMIGSTQPKRFQPVYVADIDGSLLCLNFWSGIKEYGYDDIVQVKRFVAISNLQWRSNSAHDVIPTMFVTDLTIFTENPKHQDMIDSMKELQNTFHDVNIEEFVAKCCEKIAEHKERPKLNVSGNSSSINRSLNSSSPGMISVQTRIDRLRMYGNPPDVSPISTGKLSRSVRKGFKLPSCTVGCEES